MRVVGGIYKSRKLVYPKSKTTRPTSDMVKVAVFNMLNLNRGIVLDLFAGSGSYGIEALSRGAKFAYFVDIDNDAINSILTNIKNLNLEEQASINKMNYKSFLKKNATLFNYIFLDPPFNFKNYHDLIEETLLYLHNDGRIILEVNKDFFLNENSKFTVVKDKIYGNKKIIILHKS